MASRLNLHTELEQILDSEEVYFQPPESILMHYPSIVYKLMTPHTRYADDNPYFYRNRYEIEFIFNNPDDEYHWIDEMYKRFTHVTHIKSFTMHNLHHSVFALYY